MSSKSVIACLAAAFAMGVLMLTDATAANNTRQPGTYMWPPCAPPTACAGSTTEGTRCGYVRIYRHKSGKAQWAYQCR
jgi:hypothetical protein